MLEKDYRPRIASVVDELYNRPVLCLKKIIARESLLLLIRSAIIRDCSVKTNEMKLAK